MHTYRLAEIKDGTGFAADARFEQVTDYNGWTNRETWAVALHINNDQGWQESVHDALRQAADEYRDEDCRACEDGETHPVADYPPHLAGARIQENVEAVFDPYDYDAANAKYLADVLIPRMRDIGSLWRVDWDALGASFLADLAEQGES